MEHLSTRIGNVIMYAGGLSEYYGKPAEIISIVQLNNENTYLLKLKNWKKEQVEIRAYNNEIEPIVVNLSLIAIMGFTKEKKLNVFSLNGIKIFRPIFLKRLNGGGDFYDDKGFVVVERDLPIPFTEDQVKNSTTPVPFVHLLQNYYNDKIKEPIDPELFL